MRASLVLSALVLCAAASAQTFTITQSAGNDNFGARSTGQTFTPNVGIVPATTLPALPLTRITLYAGNSGAVAPSATTYLNIYSGDPNAGGTFVGSSTNSVDTNGLTFRTPLTWDFTGVVLFTTIEYWAIMSSTNQAGNLDVAASLEAEPRNGPPGPNAYTGGAGLIANIVPHPNSVDAKFDIEFTIAIAGAFSVSGTGCPGPAGQMGITGQGVPQVGQTFLTDFTNLSTPSLAFGVLGFSDTVWNGNLLPIPLSTVLPGAPAACQILVSPDQTFALSRSGATGTLTLDIPNDPSFAGASFFLQAAEFTPGTLSLSALGAAVIGS